jgi:DNA-binding FrmR family transcriptional regulator
MLSDKEKTKLANRLRRIAGQVSGIERMIDEDEYCIDILMQIAAANGALGKVGQIILESHLQSCVTSAMNDGSAKERREKLDELIKVFSKYARIAN